MKKFYSTIALLFVVLTMAAQDFTGPFLNPEGNSEIYKVGREGFAPVWGMLEMTNEDEASEVIFGENNEVYFKIMPHAGYTGYVKGTVQGDKIVVELPQCVGTIYDEWEEEDIDVYIDLLRNLKLDDELWYGNSGEKSTIELSFDGVAFSYDIKGEDGEYPEAMIGIVTDLDPDSYSWTGYGDWQETFYPNTEQALALPEGLETEEWCMFHEYESRKVTVAVDGNDFWLGNLTDELPDAFVKGTIEGDKVSFPLTYLGYSEMAGNFVYFVPCYWEEFYYEPWEEWTEDYLIHDTWVFDYDAEAKSLSSIDDFSAIMIGTSNRVGDLAGTFTEMFVEPTILWLDPAHADDPLENPEFLEAYHDSWFECDIVEFFLPSINSGRYPLDTERLTYVFYIDGEPFTFTPDVYVGLEEEMTAIPFDFCDWENQDIWCYYDGQTHQIALYQEPESYSTVGVKIFYEKEDGSVIESEYVEANIEELSDGDIVSGIRDAKTQTSNKTKFYDLQGRQMSKPSGLCIKVGKDGTKKVVVR